MPQFDGQGLSDRTPHKLDGFSRILDQNIGIVSGKHKGAPYVHIDLNAGSGTNLIDGVEYPGSPMLLAAMTRKWSRPVWAHFVDRDDAACDSLIKRLAEHNATIGRDERPHFRVFRGDNATFLLGAANLLERDGVPRDTFGSILCDPNGADVPFDTLRAFSWRFRRIDIILAISVTAMNRARTSSPNGRFGDKYLADIPSFFSNKRNWSIAPPHPADKWRRVILVGRNYSYGLVSGFYQWGSVAAERVLAEYNLTKNEKKKA